MLWLDTSVIMKFTKIKRGEALQEIEVELCNRLYDLVYRLVPATGKCDRRAIGHWWVKRSSKATASYFQNVVAFCLHQLIWLSGSSMTI
jgi:hypothetical protein